MIRRLTVLLFVASSFGQTISTPFPTDHGMYVEDQGKISKIIGQIAEFKRSGSLLVSDLTAGIKTRKENIQLLGATAQTVVSAQPVFYFIPAKQEQEAGLNAGDLILIRLEEKSKRRQFEIAAAGAWRKSSGITLTHQIQLLRDEIKPDVYKIMPATELKKGEYALFLARGEGMAPYIYDFGVQPVHAVASMTVTTPVSKETNLAPRNTVASFAQPESSKSISAVSTLGTDRGSIGVFFEGNLDVRHDGVMVAALTPGGPSDQGGIRVGDVILAINDRYLFTIRELTEEVRHYQTGTKIAVRYRRYSTIYDTSLKVGDAP
jgi:hypothetical protein